MLHSVRKTQYFHLRTLEKKNFGRAWYIFEWVAMAAGGGRNVNDTPVTSYFVQAKTGTSSVSTVSIYHSPLLLLTLYRLKPLAIRHDINGSSLGTGCTI